VQGSRRAPKKTSVSSESTIVMIIRAALFLGLVALLAPHEPDLGLGRPGAGTWLPSPASVLAETGLPHFGQLCGACAGPGPLGDTRLMTIRIGGRGLSDVKAEIDAAVKARRSGRAAI
jgi:hypothetical protein